MARPGPKPQPTAKCDVGGCDLPRVKRIWCNKHYRRWLRCGDPTKTKHRKFCDVDGCGEPHYGRGYCIKHMARLSRNGDIAIKYKTKEFRCCHCGKTFEGPTKYMPKYCSPKCGQDENYQKKKKTISVANCENCGKSFEMFPDVHLSKYCSHQCTGKVSAIKRRTHVACSVCGDVFFTANPHLDICKKCAYRKRIKRTVKRNARRKALRRGALGPTHTEVEWESLLSEYGNMCAYCRKSASEHRDHVMPIALGGGDSIGNILPACAKCNLQKGAMHPDVWFEKINKKEGAL